jgi:hypothetical protein
MLETDDGTWMSYVELAGVLGCTANAARVRAQRARWPHRAPNKPGDRAAVLVPVDVAVRPGATHEQPMCDAPGTLEAHAPNGPEQAHEQPHVQALSAALAEQAETIRDLRARLDRAEARLDISEAERRRLSERLTGLLTSRQTGSVPSVPALREPWWRRWWRFR